MKYLLILLFIIFTGNVVLAQSSVRFIEQIEFIPSGNAGINNQLNVPVTDKVQSSGDKQQTTTLKPESSNTRSNIESISRLQAKYAMILNIEVESITNLPLYSFINEWFGAPYHMGGNDKDGIDCSGFSCTLLRKIYSVNTPRTAKEQYEASDHVNKDQLCEGDLVFFNTFGGVSHVGVYLANGYFVHASTNYGVTISNLNEGYYREKFIGAGRVK